MSRLMVLIGWLLDALSLKSLSDAIFARFAGSSDADYPVHRAIWVMCREGRYEDARRLASAHWDRSSSLRIGRDFIHVLLRLGEYQKAIEVAEKMAQKDTESPWCKILAADLNRFFGNDEDKAFRMYLDVVPACKAMLPYHYAVAVVYKRITAIYRKRGDIPNLIASMEEFLSVSPSNYRDDEFIELAELKLAQGDKEGAKKVMETSLEALRRSYTVREAYERMGFGKAPEVPPRKVPLPEITGVTRISIPTGLLTEADGPVETVSRHAKDKVQPGDVVALSSCVAAIMEGRMLMEGTVPISPVARMVARYIAGAHHTGAFKSSAPMANPLSAQTAIEEIGTLRLLIAAAIGVIGKLFKIDGWFYVVAGEQVAQIDDILGSVPPYDYYVMMGPRDACALSDKIASALGEGVGAAIVDANDLGIAWAVGYSKGMDVKWLERSLSDNPAGNQEQMTPIVIVRPDKKEISARV
jgi:tetratricopeptide (TPR) repeat protein